MWTNEKIQQWALKLSEYNCQIEYLAGKENTCADLQSRIPKWLERESVSIVLVIDDRTYQINVINPHRIRESSVDGMGSDIPEAVEQFQLPESVSEYQIDEEIRTLNEAVEARKMRKHVPVST